jgi:hypothetical protein
VFFKDKVKRKTEKSRWQLWKNDILQLAWLDISIMVKLL